ncbi:hypothetical protein P22_2723 [Propionispora sp. 2/2-37]|uniref:hypothetical protein n=1 Tax=Propionispora sp. 2/2-37 TaxID=1677858 RepID=UPI0006BB711F|nr:hypothetical protein [Propionispora sp. 2/2-37]CUH96633.1 hypothetical protein P22_2723 [Propionispora sp. 2/2-37]
MVQNINGNTFLNNLSGTFNPQVTLKTVSQKSDFDSYIQSETAQSTIPDVYSNQSENSIGSDDKKEGTKRKRTVCSQVEGKFYCTYLIDSEGNEILINQVPVEQLSQLDASATDFEKVKKETCLQSGNNSLRLKQQTNLEAAHKFNVQSMMELLKSYAGIPNQIDCKQQLKRL